MKTGKGLATFAFSLIGCAYAYGVQGVVLTEALLQAKAKQYPDMYTPEYIEETRKHSMGRISFDCSSITDLYTGKDGSANGWYRDAIEKGPISTIPEIVGLMVHKDKHMGIYIGNGEVVEARGVDYGVVITKLKDRPWLHWAKVPGLDYSQPVKCPYPEPILIYPSRIRIKGTAARWFQWHLIRAGYSCGVNPASADLYGTDGYGYNATWDAINAIQIKAGLGKGAAGAKTRAAIKKAAEL